MNGFTLSRIADLCHGRLEQAPDAGADHPISEVAIDTRTMGGGELFIALRDRRDGHDFLHEAHRKGAAAALVDDRSQIDAPPELPLIRVADPLTALHRWAGTHRAQIETELILVTGSSGKTTTKDRISSILELDGPTHRTEGNRNNHLGVPITLLGLRPEHRWAVVEIAMNHAGEIAPLAALCRPKHVVLTSIGWAHIGAFGSREAILREKLSALDAMAPDGTFYHEADPWLLDHLPDSVRSYSRHSYGIGVAADCHAEEIEWSADRTRFITRQTGPVTMPSPGPGALKAALAAILVASTLGIDSERIVQALANARPRRMRMEPRDLDGVIALLDCYNASPESSLLAVDFLKSLTNKGRRYLVFGAMRELGSYSVEAHQALGRRAAGLDGLFFLGDDCRRACDAYRGTGGKGPAAVYDRHEELAHALLEHLQVTDVVLFKGSRLAEMEKVYEICRSARGLEEGV